MRLCLPPNRQGRYHKRNQNIDRMVFGNIGSQATGIGEVRCWAACFARHHTEMEYGTSVSVKQNHIVKASLGNRMNIQWPLETKKVESNPKKQWVKGRNHIGRPMSKMAEKSNNINFLRLITNQIKLKPIMLSPKHYFYRV